MTAGQPPLAGIQVLELSSSLSGAYCAKMLADAGANVIAVEPPGGSPLRQWTAASAGPVPSPDSPGVLFEYLTAGKGSLVLDAAGPLGTLGLLAGHGVLVLGGTIRAVHQRAVALETRCRNAWMVRAAGSRPRPAPPEWYLQRMARSDGNGFRGFWETAVREELRADPSLLDDPGPAFAR